MRSIFWDDLERDMKNPVFAAEFAALLELLAEPAKDIPGLSALMNTPTVLDL